MSRPIRIIAYASGISNMGGWLTALALYSIITFQHHGSVVANSLIVLSALVPSLLLSPLAGAVLRYVGVVRTMYIVTFASAAVVAGMLFAASAPQYYVLILLQASFLAFLGPAQFVAVATFAEESDLIRANAFVSQINSATKIAAPLAAGALLAIVTPQQALAIDVCLALVAGALLLTLPNKHQPNDSAEHTDRSAIVAMLLAPTSRSIFAAVAVVMFMALTIDVLFPVYLRDRFAGTVNLFGYLLAIFSVGSIVMARVLIAHPPRSNLKAIYQGLTLASCFPLFATVASLVPLQNVSMALMACGVLLGGAGLTRTMVPGNSELQIRTPVVLRPYAGAALGWIITCAQIASIGVAMIYGSLMVNLTFYFVGLTALLGLVALTVFLGSGLTSEEMERG